MKKRIRNLPRIINAPQMRSVNRSAVLELIRQYGPIARSEIGRQLGLSLPTVMRIVDELIAEDMVRSTGETEWSSGRRRDLLEYHKDGHVVIGIDLGGSKMYGALANIGGEILYEECLEGHGTTGEESFNRLVDLIQHILDAPRKEKQQIRGIAIGAPGVTRSGEGVVSWAPSLNWREYPLKHKLEQIFPLPILVDNDVNLMALGENWFGAGQGANSMVLIAIGTGVGAGIIIDGALYRGYTEQAGEVGYMITERSELRNRYDRFGALESIISGTGIAERARNALIGVRTAEELEALNSTDIFTAARRNEPWAVDIIDETVDYLSIAIANISTILDPELVILGGGVANSAELLIPPILKRMEGIIQRIPQIEASYLGSRAAVMGAIALTIHNTSDYYQVRKIT